MPRLGAVDIFNISSYWAAAMLPLVTSTVATCCYELTYAEKLELI